MNPQPGNRIEATCTHGVDLTLLIEWLHAATGGVVPLDEVLDDAAQGFVFHHDILHVEPEAEPVEPAGHRTLFWPLNHRAFGTRFALAGQIFKQVGDVVVEGRPVEVMRHGELPHLVPSLGE